MRLGYACINTELRKKDVFCSRTCRKANYTLDKVKDLARKNCADLHKLLVWNINNNIGLMRVSSDLLPFWDHPDLHWNVDKSIVQPLEGCRFYTDKGHRLTTHPGPYTVLSSDNDAVIKKSIKTLQMHAMIGEHLYTEHYSRDYAINIHVGRNFSENAAKIFCESFKKLPTNVQQALVVENDDKPNGWSVQKLHKFIYQEVGTPITFDAHHFRFCNEGDTQEDALGLALSTWADRKPKVHYSESRPGSRPQAHSDLVKSIPCCFADLDVVVEAKLKEQAILPFI